MEISKIKFMREIIMYCKLTKLEIKVIKRALGVKRLTKKRIEQFLQKAIIAGANKGVNK